MTKVAHAVEDLLEELRSGRRRATPELVDAVLGAVDGLRAMIPRVMDGHDCGPEAAELVTALIALTAPNEVARPDHDRPAAGAGRPDDTLAPGEVEFFPRAEPEAEARSRPGPAPSRRSCPPRTRPPPPSRRPHP